MTRRDELLELAATVLEAEGLEGFGINVLARAAQVRPPSLYKHFSGLADVEAGLISRGFADFAAAIDRSLGADQGADAVTVLASTYRKQALAAPQLYRLMTSRPLDRDAIVAGVEDAAARVLIEVFGPDRARAAWAWAHGLVSLEIAGRFPAGADVDAAWQVLVTTLAESGPTPAGPA